MFIFLQFPCMKCFCRYSLIDIRPFSVRIFSVLQKPVPQVPRVAVIYKLDCTSLSLLKSIKPCSLFNPRRRIQLRGTSEHDTLAVRGYCLQKWRTKMREKQMKIVASEELVFSCKCDQGGQKNAIPDAVSINQPQCQEKVSFGLTCE